MSLYSKNGVVPQISVIIPTWNRAASIAGAVRSALAQTLPPQEVLVCDDGSSDETETVVREIGDARVKWVSGSHGGCPAIPRNRGIAAARGEWLAFLDSDDLWMPNKLERQFAAMQTFSTRASCCDATVVSPNRERKGKLLNGEDEYLDTMALLRINRVVCSSAIIRTDVIAQAGGFSESQELRALEDYALWLRVATMTPFAYVGEALVDYKDDAATSVRADQKNPWTQRLSVLDDFRSWLRVKNDGRGVLIRRVGYEILRCRVRRLASQVIR